MHHIANKNIKTNKHQSNDAIDNNPAFDTTRFNLSSGTKDPLPVVIVSLRVGKKQIATTVDGLTCLWDSGDTKIMIKIRHTKYYERNIRSNKVECSTVASFYRTTHDVKVTSFMP